MASKQKLPIFGLILLVVGAALLLERLNVVAFGWGRILWGAVTIGGAAVVVQAFLTNARGKVFWGTVLFLYGLLFLLRSLRLVQNHWELFMPATMAILGFAFLMLFVFDSKDWHLLIPSVILLGFGGAFMLTEVGYLRRWELWDSFAMWWPLILILVGLSLIFRRKKA